MSATTYTVADIAGKSDHVVAHLAAEGIALAQIELERRVALLSDPRSGYGAQERRNRLARLAA